MMNPKTFKAILPWAALALVAVMGYSAWREARADRTRVEAELEIKNKLIAELRTERAAIDKGMEARARELEHLKKDIDELKRRPLPVREVVREIKQFLPLPGDPTIVEPDPKPDGEDPAVAQAEPSLLFNPDQVKSLRDFYLDCHKATAELKACGDDKADLYRKEETYRKQVQLLQEERDSAVKAMRGGGIWQRFKRNAKWFLIGGAVGAGAAAAAK